MNIDKNMEEENTELMEDDNISDIIKSSAINKKTPGLFSDNRNINSENKEKIFNSIKNKISIYLSDYFVGKKESLRIKMKKGSSDRASFEVLNYYRSLYISKMPDLDRLYRLLKRNKVIDFPNQYTFGTSEYFEYHESGTLSIEINAILSHVVTKQDSVFDNSDIEKIKSYRTKEWMTLEESYESNLLEEEENDKNKYHLAIQSWIMIVCFSDNINYLKNNVHRDNIELATIDCLLNFIENDYYSKDLFIKGIRRLNIIEESILEGIVNKKENRKKNFDNRKSSSSERKHLDNLAVDPSLMKNIASLKDLKSKTKNKE